MTAQNPADSGPDPAANLYAHGLAVITGKSIVGTLDYERPAFVHDPRRIKHCRLGAFTLINGLNTTSMYHCDVGRYGQIGEAAIIGPPEHPMDWFSTHPFAFTRPDELPGMYRMPDFARLAPQGNEQQMHYTETVPLTTVIGHEAYIGAGAFVRRGVTIGHGAVVGARSVVLHDVPPYAIVAGTPARIIRMRFPEAIVERMLALQWWHYDLAPYKGEVDFSRPEPTLERLEALAAAGHLAPLVPDSYSVARDDTGAFHITPLDAPLYGDGAAPAQQHTTAVH